MDSVYAFILLMYAAILLVALAQKIKMAYPIILVIGGGWLGFIPIFPHLDFDPLILLVAVLPPILFNASFTLSFKEFVHYFWDIFYLAIWLVLVTTTMVAILFKWLFPELPWSLAIAFGALISPPDVVATTSILKTLSVTTRLRAILEGESLINDALALVIYRFAVSALVINSFDLHAIIPQIFYVAIGGIGLGLLLGYCFTFMSSYFSATLGVIHSFAMPYITYCLADAIGVSGVLAVVMCGLIGARILITKRPPLTRVLAWVTWDLFIILINCFIFILIGLELRVIVEKMSWEQMGKYTLYGGFITLSIVAIRFVWIYLRHVIWHIKNRHDAVKLQESKAHLWHALVSSWGAMRGIVSLIAALALPLTLSDGSALPGRDIVIFLTAEVIFLTLVIPGLTLPFLVKWLKIKPVNSHKEMIHTRQRLTELAKNEIVRMREREQIDEEESHLLHTYFHSHSKLREISWISKEHRLERARQSILHEQRERLIQMWLNDEINDFLLNDLQRELDMEDSHLARGEI